jgi:excisionase family DNA binding protein
MENNRVIALQNGEVLTTEDVAELLKLSRATVVRRFRDGTIPAKLIGTKWRCLRSDVDKLFQAA